MKLNLDRIAVWMRNGARPSDTVSRLFKKAGHVKAAAGAATPA